MKLHQSDAYITPTFLVVLLLGLVYLLSNYWLFTLNFKRVYMKPAFGPGAAKLGSYWGSQALLGDGSEAVVYRTPDMGVKCVGRVIAIEGSIVEIRGGKIYLNGSEHKEPYLKVKSTSPDVPPITIPHRSMFILLDQRSQRGASRLDSRYYGPIPLECVLYTVSVEKGKKPRGK